MCVLGLTIKGELQPVIRHLALKVPRSLYGDGHLHAHASKVRTGQSLDACTAVHLSGRWGAVGGPASHHAGLSKPWAVVFYQVVPLCSVLQYSRDAQAVRGPPGVVGVQQTFCHV